MGKLAPNEARILIQEEKGRKEQSRVRGQPDIRVSQRRFMILLETQYLQVTKEFSDLGRTSSEITFSRHCLTEEV